MTPDEAVRILEEGCMHNPWTEDVCPACAKQLVGVIRQLQGEPRPTCKICGTDEHTTRQHIDAEEYLT